MIKEFFLLGVMVFTSFLASTHAEQVNSLTINIISQNLFNGAGKQADVALVKDELEKLGHHVNLFDFHETSTISHADINLFFAQFKSSWFSEAKLNWFIPNAEFCDGTLDDLLKFDLILCKTQESLKIFEPISRQIYWLGFTSYDQYDPNITKDFSKHLHLAGKSKMKGTKEVLDAWYSNPGLPYLTLVTSEDNKFMPPSRIKPKNLNRIPKRVSDDNLIILQNNCGIHVCPSKTEGFGHYIMEGMSTGAVIITTDAPPMNEFISDKRCLVDYQMTGTQKYATIFIVDDKKLALKVKELQNLSPEELQTIGQRNREEYLRRTAEFKQNLHELMNRTVQDFNKI